MTTNPIEDLAKESNSVDVTEAESHYMIQCEDIRLISSVLQPIIEEGEESGESQFAFRIWAMVEDLDSFSYLEVQAKLFIPGEPEEMRGYNLRFVLMGKFHAQDEISTDAMSEFVKIYTLSLLWPYAREYTSDQLRRTGEHEVVLPIINPQAVTEQLVENDLVEVEIIQKTEEN